MCIQLDITLTEEDYLYFNEFHTFETPQGKKQGKRSRMGFACFMLALIVVEIIVLEATIFSLIYAAVLGIFAVLFLLFLKKVVGKNIRKQIENLKKQGKLPYEPTARMEFYEDRMVEIGPTCRSEQSYGNIERIYVVKGRYVFLYTSSIMAQILPIPQITEKIELRDFLDFISARCSAAEYYEV